MKKNIMLAKDATDLISEKKKTVTHYQIKAALEYPGNFGYHGDNDELFKTWALGPVVLTRDSRMFEESNHAALKRVSEYLVKENVLNDENFEFMSCDHWAVGWVEHFSFKVVELDGSPTNEFAFLLCWEEMLEEYPLADEDDLGMREWNYGVDIIQSTLKGKTNTELTDEHISQISNTLCEMPNEDYWYEKEIIEAAKELGIYNDDDE